MKSGVVIFSRPGSEDVELVRVENGTHIYHLTPVEAVNMAADLMRYAAEILLRPRFYTPVDRHPVDSGSFLKCSIEDDGNSGVYTGP